MRRSREYTGKNGTVKVACPLFPPLSPFPTADVFRKAGYDYDASIRALANDLRTNIDKIPQNVLTPANRVIIELNMMKSKCDYEDIDCLSFFEGETLNAVKFIFGGKD